MGTVGDVVDRVFRDWLHPSDDQPAIVTLADDVTAAAMSLEYEDDALAPDEESLLAPGVLVDIGLEQVRITDVDDTANTLIVVRGANGTEATAHTSGAAMVPAPVFSRKSVFDAVCENVVALYPSLWHVATETITTASTPVEVPAEVVTAVEFLWQNGTRYQKGSVELLPNFPPSSTGKAISIFGVPADRTGYFTYRSRFAKPDDEADDLQAFGVDASWERIVAIGAASQVLAGRDLDPVTAEYLTEQLEREAFPAGSAARARDSLLRYYQFLISDASRNLRADSTPPVVVQI